MAKKTQNIQVYEYEEGEYEKYCPCCGGRLYLTSCLMHLSDLPMSLDGFWVGDAGSQETTDEVVACVQCKYIGPLRNFDSSFEVYKGKKLIARQTDLLSWYEQKWPCSSENHMFAWGYLSRSQKDAIIKEYKHEHGLADEMLDYNGRLWVPRVLRLRPVNKKEEEPLGVKVIMESDVYGAEEFSCDTTAEEKG